MAETKTHFSTCVLCEAMCGIAVETDGDRVVSIRGDQYDPLSHGYICPKGPALRDIHEDPDRLRHPIRRVGNSWQQISWSEALDESARRIAGIQKDYGNNGMGIYFGNPMVHNLGALLFLPPFLKTLSTRNRYTPTSADQLPHMFVSYQMFGHQLLLPIPDIDRTDYMLILGANPLASNGSLMSAPNVRRRLKAIQQRGGRVVVMDPRKSETAKLADEHIFVRPGSDALFLFSMLHCIFARRDSTDDLPALYERLQVVIELAGRFPPDVTEPITGVPIETVHRIADQFLSAETAVCYGRIGTSTQPYGALCAWLINVMNIVTGNFDRPGGAMFTEPAVDVLDPRLGSESGSFGQWTSRVRGLPEFNHELPVSTLADEMLVDGPGRIRGMIACAGNPVLSAPNGTRLDRGFESLEFMVSIDSYVNETTRHSHIILPPVSPLEREHYDLIFRALAVRNTARFAPAVFEPPPDARHDWQILLQLQNRLERIRYGWRPLFAARQWTRERLGPSGLLSLAFRLGNQRYKRRNGSPRLSLKKLKRQLHGVDLGPLTPCLPDRLPDGRKRVDLAPQLLVDDVSRLKRTLKADEATDENSLMLIGRRDLRSNNSWMHNSAKLMGGKPRCVLLMHPDDAERRGLRNSDEVRVSSRVGKIRAPVSLTDDIMPGVVSLPHGYGHGRSGVKLQVALQHAGASINDVTDDTRIDELCGNAAFCGIPVRVDPV